MHLCRCVPAGACRCVCVTATQIQYDEHIYNDEIIGSQTHQVHPLAHGQRTSLWLNFVSSCFGSHPPSVFCSLSVVCLRQGCCHRSRAWHHPWLSPLLPDGRCVHSLLMMLCISALSYLTVMRLIWMSLSAVRASECITKMVCFFIFSSLIVDFYRNRDILCDSV